MKIERVDDLPLINHFIAQSGLADLMDQHFPDHGLWQGISGGKLAVGWIQYILSEADHRLSHVEGWAEQRLETLGVLLEEPDLRSVDFCDDRLGRLLDRYSNNDKWFEFEQALGSKLVRIYKLHSNQEAGDFAVVRADSFNVPQFRDQTDLFRLGFSKQRRSDQPFCKVMMATLDPAPLPLAVDIIKGSGPDVDHYLSVINRAKSTLGDSGHLFVGDSQLGSHGNRMTIAQNQDYYLCPLSRKQCSENLLQEYIQQAPDNYLELPGIYTEAKNKRGAIYFYEVHSTVQLADEQNQIKWEERRVLAYSPKYAEELAKSFDNRLDEAEEDLKKLTISKKGRRNPKTLDQLINRCGRVLKKYKMEDFFELSYDQTIKKRTIQRHKDRPQRVEKKIILQLQIERKVQNIKRIKRKQGWQLFGTNLPVQLADPEQVVRLYREEYRIEHLFDYMINRDVGLLPVYLQKQERIIGLIRLLTVAMQFSILIQYQIRNQLSIKKQKMKGGYAGNKNRVTDLPTTPMILRIFRGVSVAISYQDESQYVQMPALHEQQQFVLDILEIPDLYLKTVEVLASKENLRET